MNDLPKGRGRPPRLGRVFQCYDPPCFFVTFGTSARKPVLACERVHEAFCAYARIGQSDGIAVGRYVLMPDHVHVFVQLPRDRRLDQWVRLLKQHVQKAAGLAKGTWQRGFFDHLLRNAESYTQKWEYVVQNPVRAGLVEHAESWPYGGEITPIRYG
jgi:putative transposase